MRDQTRDYIFCAKLTQQYLPDGFYAMGPEGTADRVLRTHGASLPIKTNTLVLSADDTTLDIFRSLIEVVRRMRNGQELRIWRYADVPGFVFVAPYDFVANEDDAVHEAWDRGVNIFDWATMQDIEVEQPK